MTNEELKQKIVKVLKETINWTTDYSIPIGIVYKSELDEIADALIAAGIVDKSDYASMKETAVRYKAEVSKAKGRAKEAELRAEVAESELERYTGLIKPLEDENTRLKHRAEVAERALLYAVSEYRCDECPCEECNAEIRGSNECIDLIIKTYKEQVEKELAEEGGR